MDSTMVREMNFQLMSEHIGMVLNTYLEKTKTLLLEDKSNITPWSIGYEMRNDQLWSIPEPTNLDKLERRTNSQIEKGGSSMKDKINNKYKGREVYTSYDDRIGMLFCYDEYCIANRPLDILAKDDIEVYEHWNQWFPWLIDESKKFKYQYPKLSSIGGAEPAIMGSMFDLLNERHQHRDIKDLKVKAKEIQRELYIAWSSIKDAGNLAGKTPVGILKEISHQDTKRVWNWDAMEYLESTNQMGSSDLVCPYCGSHEVRMDVGGHPEEGVNIEDKVKELLKEDYESYVLDTGCMDLDLKDKLKAERKEIRAYRLELDGTTGPEYNAMVWEAFGNEIPYTEDSEDDDEKEEV